MSEQSKAIDASQDIGDTNDLHECKQLLREAMVKLVDVQGTSAPKDYACNLIKRIRAMPGVA